MLCNKFLFYIGKRSFLIYRNEFFIKKKNVRELYVIEGFSCVIFF